MIGKNKFRVWTGTEMEYNVLVGKFGAFYINPSNNGMNESDAASLTPCNTKYPDNYPVMKYAGFADKNGVDIYSGDILIAANGGKYAIGFGEFEYQTDDEPLLCIGFHWEDGEPFSNGVYEVIGNIYENKDLLP